MKCLKVNMCWQNNFNSPWHTFCSGILLAESNPILPNDIPSFGVLMIAVKSAV